MKAIIIIMRERDSVYGSKNKTRWVVDPSEADSNLTGGKKYLSKAFQKNEMGQSKIGILNHCSGCV